MENLAHIIVKIGAVREDYYFDGKLDYHDVNGKVYECSNCGKRIGEHKLSNISICPHCGAKFDSSVSDAFKEKCEKLIAYFQKEKAEMKEKMDRSHKRKREELRWDLRTIKVNLYYFHRMLRIWEKGEVSYNDFELCNEAYDEIFGESTCESAETVL